MKNTPATLTLLALTAAATAQTAPAAAPAATGFNYNTVALTSSTEDFKDIADHLTLTTVSVTNRLGKNVVASLGLVVAGAEKYDNEDLSDGIAASIGSIHSLNSTTDLVFSVSSLNANTSESDSQSISKLGFDVALRHNLGSGLELTASVGRDTYTHEGSDSSVAASGSDRSTASLGVSYALTKEIAVAAKANWAFSESDDTDSRGYTLSASYSY